MADMNEMITALRSGKLSAKETAPFLAGLVDGVLKNLFIPLTGAKVYKEFVHADHPVVAEVTLNNNQILRITIEAIQ